MFPWQCTFIDFEDEDGECVCQPCDLHTDESRQEQFDEWTDASAGERTELEKLAGIHTWHHGFTGVPEVSQSMPAKICPFDFMHCSAQGMLKHEVAGFIFTAIKRRKWFSWDDFVAAFTAYPWPKEQGMPPVPTATFLDGRRVDGKSGSFPKINIHFHWTASQVCLSCVRAAHTSSCAYRVRASRVCAPLVCLVCMCASFACLAAPKLPSTRG